METRDILNLIAIIVISIVAVLIGQWLQNRSVQHWLCKGQPMEERDFLLRFQQKLPTQIE